MRRATKAASLSRRETLMVAVVLLVTVLVYLRSFTNGFVSDDRALIVNNPYLGQWWFPFKSWVGDEYWFRDPGPYHMPMSSRYRPLFLIWLWLNYQIFGMKPAGWHVAALAVHVLVVWLFYKVAMRLTAERSTAILAAMLFGLIPVHAEAVIWPAGFGLVMAAGFELAAFYLLMERSESWRRNWILAVACFAGAMLSHETAATFPALVVAYVFLLESPGPEPQHFVVKARLRRALICSAPFAVEVVLYLVARRLVLGFLATDPTTPVNDATLAQALMTIPHALAAYLSLLAVPWLVGPAHPVVFVRSAASPQFCGYLAMLVAIAIAFWIVERHHPHRRLHLFCAVWLLIALAPVLHLHALLKDQLVHDGYLYLPSVGWCIVLADWAVWLAPERGVTQRPLWAGAAVVAGLYAIALWNALPFWHDDITLYTRFTQVLPQFANPHVQLAITFRQREDLIDAERELKKALRLEPNDGAALYFLGFVHARMGRVKEGADEAARGLKEMPIQDTVEAWVVLAKLYDLSGDKAGGEDALRHAESLPGPMGALASADFRLSRGDAAGAERILRGLSPRYPQDPRVWAELGRALAAQNRHEEALSAYSRALELVPKDSAINFLAAVSLYKMGRNQEALAHCRTVLTVVPGDPGTHALIAQIERSSSEH